MESSAAVRDVDWKVSPVTSVWTREPQVQERSRSAMSEDVLGGYTLPSSLRLCESSRCQARRCDMSKSEMYRASSKCQFQQCDVIKSVVKRV